MVNPIGNLLSSKKTLSLKDPAEYSKKFEIKMQTHDGSQITET